MLRLTRPKLFSEFRTAAEIWSSAAPPFENKSATGSRRIKHRIIDFQAANKIGATQEKMIDGLHSIPIAAKGRMRSARSQILDRKHYNLSKSEVELMEEMEKKLEVKRNAERAANQMSNQIRAFGMQGRTSASYSLMSLPVPNPIPATGVDFSDYECKMIQVNRISHMTGSIGRVYGIRVILALGNKNGAFSWASANGENLGEATKKAMLRAQSRIEFYDLYKGKTVFHDVSAAHVREKVDIVRQPDGYGVRGSQLMCTLANLAGLTDIYIRTARVKDRKSPLGYLRAFEKCLKSMETPEQIADRTGLHVVEMDPQDFGKPRIIAEPTGFKEGDDDNLEPFDQYTAYFMSQPDARNRAAKARLKSKYDSINSWCQPNWSQLGYGWRGRTMIDENQPHAVQPQIFRNMRHKSYTAANGRRMGEAFEHQFLSSHMKGSQGAGGLMIAGDPYFPEPDIPEELEGIDQLTIDEERDEFRQED